MGCPEAFNVGDEGRDGGINDFHPSGLRKEATSSDIIINGRDTGRKSLSVGGWGCWRMM